MANLGRSSSDIGYRALRAKGASDGDEATRTAREILLRMIDRAGRGEEHIDPAIDEIAAALREHEHMAIDRAFRAAWRIGGRYNWQLMHGSGIDKPTLHKAHGAWEAAQAIRVLRPRLMLPPPEPEVVAEPTSGVLRQVLRQVLRWVRTMLRWIWAKLASPSR